MSEFLFFFQMYMANYMYIFTERGKMLHEIAMPMTKQDIDPRIGSTFLLPGIFLVIPSLL